MEHCPQCNTELGEGAKSCAACGWTRSKSKIWIILGSIFGVLALGCCGLFAWFGMKAAGVAEKMQVEFTTAMLKTYHVQVLSWAEKNDALPDTLDPVGEEPVGVSTDGQGGDVTVKFENQAGEKFIDAWQRAVRYTKNDDGTFEIRSAGADATFDTEDDLVETGSADEDLEAVKEDLRRYGKEIEKKMQELIQEEFGFDIKDGQKPASPEPSDPAEEAPVEEAPAREGR